MTITRMHKKISICSIFTLIIFSLISLPAFAFERDITVLLFKTRNAFNVYGNRVTATSKNKAVRLNGTSQIYVRDNKIVIAGHSFSKGVKISSDSPITVNNKKYHGYLLLDRQAGEIIVRNVVNSEKYLESVVKSEMSPSWPVEALKAQAVLARTYIISSGKHGSLCDVCATTHCQVYNGIVNTSENLRTAIRQTRGQILRYNNAPANVFYHADSGGIVTSSENVWGRPVPYLKTVFEPVKSVNPNCYWKVVVNNTDLQSKLIANGINVGRLIYLKPVKRDNSGRVKEIMIQGSSSASTISGNKLRSIVGPVILKSTLFDFSDFSQVSYVLNKKSPEAESELKQEEAVPAPEVNTAESDVTQDTLVEMANQGYFTTEELMYMLSTPDKIAEHARFAAMRKKNGKKYRKKNMLSESTSQSTSVKHKGNYKITDVNSFSMEASEINSDKVVFHGLGYGHGVGMSQWGARSLAENGWTYKEILNLYFKGTAITE